MDSYRIGHYGTKHNLLLIHFPSVCYPNLSLKDLYNDDLIKTVSGQQCKQDKQIGKRACKVYIIYVHVLFSKKLFCTLK